MERTASPLSAATGAVIRGRYKKRGLTLAKLVKRTGIKSVTLQRVIAGTSELDMDQLYALANALGTTVSSLLAEAEEDLAAMSGVASTNDSTSTEDRYRRGDLAAAAEQRTDDDPDEEPDDT